MSDVLDEILREILSRLPVAPLLRFRCVSKWWKSLIDNQQFIKHHLDHSRKTNSNLNVILDCQRHLYSADFDLLNENNMATFKQLTHPLEATYGSTEILGSCDGLLVLRNEKADVTILWNPSVRRFHVIPLCGIELAGENKDIFYGFGYDVVSDDYKLIRIVLFYGKDDEELNSEVKVYSLKSDSWRKIPDFPYYIRYCVKAGGMLANGALHWIVSREKNINANNLVAAFDLGTEEYRLMPLPKFAGDGDDNDDDDDTRIDLLALGGCLGLMCYDYHVDIWVMKEYGVQESWSILLKFDFDYLEFVTPLAYSQCRKKSAPRTRIELCGTGPCMV